MLGMYRSRILREIRRKCLVESVGKHLVSLSIRSEVDWGGAARICALVALYFPLMETDAKCQIPHIYACIRRPYWKFSIQIHRDSGVRIKAKHNQGKYGGEKRFPTPNQLIGDNKLFIQVWGIRKSSIEILVN